MREQAPAGRRVMLTEILAQVSADALQGETLEEVLQRIVDCVGQLVFAGVHQPGCYELERVSGRQATILVEPGPRFRHYACERPRCQPR